MTAAVRSSYASIRLKGWLLWTSAFALVLMSTGIVYLFHIRLQGAHEGDVFNPWLEEAGTYRVGIFLGGMVLLFILYTIWKQTELNALRDELQREEAERVALQARLSELVELVRVTTTTGASFALDDLLSIIVRRSVGALRAQHASIMLVDAESRELRTCASYGMEHEYALGGRRQVGEGISGWVAQNKRPLQLVAGRIPPEVAHLCRSTRSISSALSVPITKDDRCVGVLNVSRIHDPIPLSDDQMGVLCVFAEQIGVLIEQASVLDELRVKASALERDNTRLMEFAQIRDVFLSTASHELRTPLTSVIAYAELLSDHNGRLGQEDQAEFLNRLKTEAKRLHALVENILDLTQLETGKVQLNLQETGINHVVRSAVETSAVMAGKLNVRIEENYEPKEKPVSLDEVKIRQVVINLLTNAIRFSPEGGSVRISTMCSGAQMVVSVTDDGPGVPGNDLQGIFALFDQGLRKSSTNSSGLGIGLYIAKQIVELHDGKVGVDTKPGKGSTFWVRLPISNRSAGVDERAA